MKKIILISVAVIMTSLAITNPERPKHESLVKAKKMEAANADRFSGWAYNYLDRFSDKLIENRLEYNNYVFFSTTENDYGKTKSVGIFGKVYEY